MRNIDMTEQKTRRPTHPGIILKEIYLDGLGIGITEFAERIGVSRKTISAVVNGRARVTPVLAVRFAAGIANDFGGDVAQSPVRMRFV